VPHLGELRQRLRADALRRGVRRAQLRVLGFESSEPFIAARVEVITDTAPADLEAQALVRTVQGQIEQYVNSGASVPPEVAVAARNISDGGLLVALAESCFAAPERRGAVVTLASELPLEAVCFGEEPSRLLLEVDEKHLADLLRVAAQYDVEARQLGWTTAGEFRVHFNGKVVLDEDIALLAEAWRTGLTRRMRGAAA